MKVPALPRLPGGKVNRNSLVTQSRSGPQTVAVEPIYASALERLGISAVQPGETLDLRVTQGQRGLQVTEVLGVDSSTRTPFESSQPGSISSSAEASIQESGTVKWYSAMKRFGFIVRDDGGKDIFVHASVLQRAGIDDLSPGQRVTVDIIEGRKGPEASSIQLI